MTARVRLSLIAAVDQNLAIGRNGAMPWHLPDDLRRFKSLTVGKPVLMGRKTALAIGRTLPGRLNLVLSRAHAAPFAEQQAVGSLDAALDLASADELMVIGGGEVYALAMPHADRLYLTHIHTAAVGADAWFPHFDQGRWRRVDQRHHEADAQHAFAFDFIDYRRVLPD